MSADLQSVAVRVQAGDLGGPAEQMALLARLDPAAIEAQMVTAAFLAAILEATGDDDAVARGLRHLRIPAVIDAIAVGSDVRRNSSRPSSHEATRMPLAVRLG